MNPINFGILGPGVVAEYFLQAIRASAGARLAAVGHYRPERFDEISAAFGAPCLATQDVIDHPDIDVICICTPSGQHAEQAVRAAEAGKHVLVEKPMALTLDDADRMIEVCQKKGVALGVVFQRRTEPVFQRVRQAVEAGDLGLLNLGVLTMPYVRAQAYYDSAPWRGTWSLDGGGVLMNQGIHLVDLLIWYMGDPVAIQATAATLRRDIEVEDTLTATLRFANGALASVSATTTAAPGFAHRLEIYGTKGAIQIEGEQIYAWTLVDGHTPTIEPLEPGRAPDAGSGSDPRGISPSGHTAILRDFMQAVREGRPPLVDGHEGRRSLATILAIYEAAGLHPA